MVTKARSGETTGLAGEQPSAELVDEPPCQGRPRVDPETALRWGLVDAIVERDPNAASRGQSDG
jgi:hypothetical protein